MNCKRLHGVTRPAGSTGEWRVEKQRLRWDVLDAFAQAAQQAGIPATDDFNSGNNEGVGYFEVNQKKRLALEHRQGLFAPHLLRPTQLRDVDQARRQPICCWSSRSPMAAIARCTGVRAGVGRAAAW